MTKHIYAVIPFLLFGFLSCGTHLNCAAPPTKNASKKINEQGPKLLGTFGSWRTYEAMEGKNKVCYAVSFPQKQEGKYKKRGKVYWMITHRPEHKAFHVVSHSAGYPFTSGQDVLITLKGKKESKEFVLFTEGETAWSHNSQEDEQVTKIMASWGAELIVQGQSHKGVKTTDTYSLKGVADALQAINKACKVK